MQYDYRLTHTRPGKGIKYHDKFRNNAHRAMVWALERQFLDDIVQKAFPCGKISHFDFACGTGRILKHLQKHTDLSVGVDLSEDMLGVAVKEIPQAELILADITRNDVLGDRKFDLITAFRFFPNAQPELRMEAMRVLVKHMRETGCIIFNNHLNSSSLLRRIHGISGQPMSQAEVKKLAVSNGLKIVKVYHVGVFPANESNTYLPGRVLLAVERIASRFQILRMYAQNLIYVCMHADE